MKRFNQWLNAAPQVVRVMYTALLGLDGATPVSLPNGRFGYRPQNFQAALAACPAGVRPGEWADFLRLMARGAPESLFEGWVIGGLFRQGPRVYCPTADEFRALSQVELRIPWDMYRQPFEVMCLAIPDGVLPSPVSDEVGDPCVAIIRHDHAKRLFSMTAQGLRANGSWGANLTGQYSWVEGSDETIEDHISKLPDPADVSGTEDECLGVVRRVAINAFLLLSNKGARRLGVTNPEFEQRLTQSLKKKKLPDAVRKANEDALRMMPVVYGFDQSVRLYERESDCDGTGPGGWAVRPHWRRGHWANQAHGPGGSLRKLIFRPAVMINAEKFAGDVCNTRTVYTTSRAGGETAA